VTLSALSCGVSAIRSALLGYYEWSVLYLCLAAVFDGLDGHVARLLHAVTEMGAELDSLCDLVDFGVAPCLVVYSWLQHQPTSNTIPDGVIWGSCLAFVCCCAFRLARFNLTDANAPKAIVEAVKAETIGSEDDIALVPTASPKKDRLHHRIGRTVVRNMSQTTASKKGMELITTYVTKKKFFQGVPAPAAGALALTPMIWTFHFGQAPFGQPQLAVVVTLLTIGLLMVVTLPTLSSKMFMRNPRKESHLVSKSTFSLLFKISLVVTVLLVIIYLPWHLYLTFCIIYGILLPFGPLVHHLSE